MRAAQLLTHPPATPPAPPSAALTKTDERAKQVLFVAPNYYSAGRCSACMPHAHCGAIPEISRLPLLRPNRRFGFACMSRMPA